MAATAAAAAARGRGLTGSEEGHAEPTDPADDEYKGGRIAVDCRPRSGELELFGVSFASCQHTSKMTGTTYSDVVWSLHIRRRPSLYLWKGVVPLLLCFLYGLCGLLLDPVSELGNRLNLLAALFLSCFAIQWTLTERVPQLPYLTLLDHLLFAVVFALVLVAVGSCVAHVVEKERRRDAEERENGAGSELLLVHIGLVDLLVLMAIACFWLLQVLMVTKGPLRVQLWRLLGLGSGKRGGEQQETNDANLTFSCFGTRPFRSGTQVMNAVCVTTPGNTFKLWEKDYGTGILRRFGQPGDHAGENEAF